MEKTKKIDWQKILPFILCIVVIILDQVTKGLVVNFVRETKSTDGVLYVKYSWFNDFIRIIHIRNTGVAFSMGDSWNPILRKIVFVVLPLVVMAIVVRVYFKSKDLTNLQRWCICGILGGGIGNLIDRIFRPTGVVDFIDVKWFGFENLANTPLDFLSWNRWPTFNVADAAVVVCGIILIISFIVMLVRDSKNGKKQEQGNK